MSGHRRTGSAHCGTGIAKTACAALVLVVATGAAAPVAPTAPVATSSQAAPAARDDPWAARDGFAWSGAVPARPGTRLAAAVTGWEALPGDLATDLCLAHEPEGWGFSTSWRRFWLGDDADADDVEALLVRRTADARLAAGAGRLRQGTHRVDRWVAAGDARVIGPLVAGARAALFPGSANAAPEITARLCAATGPWWGGLELGPRSGDLRVSVGLRARPGLIWTTTWAGDHPRLGLAWNLGGAELRASQAAHPLLGSIQRVAVVAGGRRP